LHHTLSVYFQTLTTRKTLLLLQKAAAMALASKATGLGLGLDFSLENSGLWPIHAEMFSPT